MVDRLKGKTAIVFGAGSSGPGWGNGKAAAVAYAREGARSPASTSIAGRGRRDGGDHRGEGGSAIAIAADVTDTASVERAVAATIAHSAASTSCTTMSA